MLTWRDFITIFVFHFSLATLCTKINTTICHEKNKAWTSALVDKFNSSTKLYVSQHCKFSLHTFDGPFLRKYFLRKSKHNSQFPLAQKLLLVTCSWDAAVFSEQLGHWRVVRMQQNLRARHAAPPGPVPSDLRQPHAQRPHQPLPEPGAARDGQHLPAEDLQRVADPLRVDGGEWQSASRHRFSGGLF